MAKRPSRGGLSSTRAHRGSTSYYAGLAAEDSVAADYARRGFPVAARRWRGQGGEIDLVIADGTALIFVEVKQSRDFASAASHVSARQIARLYDAANEYMGHMPTGLLTECRFDVALVDGTGALQIVENAFM